MIKISAHNLRAFAVTGAGAISYVGLCSYAGKRRLLPERLSRKLMHIGTGTLYMMCWPLYDAATYNPWLCASVPFLASLNFALVGSGILPDFLNITQGATRSGTKQELLKGPLLYGLVHSAMTVAWWKNPAAVIGLSVLCGGDGLAEVVGSSMESSPLTYNSDKTVAGTAACFVGGAVNALALTSYFMKKNAFVNPPTVSAAMVPAILTLALVGAVVESLPLPLTDMDNITVPVTVAALTKWIL